MNRVLHVVHRDPLACGDLDVCSRLLGPGDGILLRGAAVVAALDSAKLPDQEVRWYVLESDLALHGMNARAISEQVARVDFPGFVDLVCEYDLCQSW